MLFSAPMVRAILDGRKTVTRRVVKPPRNRPAFVLLDHGHGWWPYQSDDGESELCDDGMEHPYTCPYGKPGDRLWVREAFMHEPADYCWEASVSIPCRPAVTIYRADHDERESRGAGWKPSIHMPRWAGRITLEVVGVRVERLREISRGDAMAEGCPFPNMAAGDDPRQWYAALWDQINGAGSWDANPWVWVVEFRKVAP
ncbi:MAG: hypothetical protein KA179_09930 [Sulfuritalea sp.]|nr:hypothetical protein [Sulfuritalea sp.]